MADGRTESDGLDLGWERDDGKLREGLAFLQKGKKCKRIRHLPTPLAQDGNHESIQFGNENGFGFSARCRLIAS